MFCQNNILLASSISYFSFQPVIHGSPMKDRSIAPGVNALTMGYISLGIVPAWYAVGPVDKEGAKCTSAVEHSLIGSIAHGGPIELFLVPASASRLV